MNLQTLLEAKETRLEVLTRVMSDPKFEDIKREFIKLVSSQLSVETLRKIEGLLANEMDPDDLRFIFSMLGKYAVSMGYMEEEDLTEFFEDSFHVSSNKNESWAVMTWGVLKYSYNAKNRSKAADPFSKLTAGAYITIRYQNAQWFVSSTDIVAVTKSSITSKTIPNKKFAVEESEEVFEYAKKLAADMVQFATTYEPKSPSQKASNVKFLLK